ncbi:hypothetical protein [Enterovirga aerilata]|uniref:Uncharacterized protein n=1 Tax=Enterovirga aerilata TaxID=2730920 RepID=A0A849I992_9HYPH|nr:hypothetical protein [Enterovirga sp. DB1703]NNM73881.1 hypothetical protein [Enterovirga sp. DB1703]
MKAGNYHRVILVDEDDRPWAVPFGRDAKAEHERHRCEGLRDWLGIDPTATTVGEARCRLMEPCKDWALAEPAVTGAATVLVLN